MTADNLGDKGCPQRDSAEREGYAEAHRSFRRIWKERDSAQPELLEEILDKDNLNRAYKRVKANKGAPGVDGMTVDEVFSYIREHGHELKDRIRRGQYTPQPVRRVEILKPDGGIRKLGIPTVLDRTIQQAIAQRLIPIYLLDASEEEPDAADTEHAGKADGTVEFRHVAFGYTPDSQLMTDISLKVKPGQKIAIVGPTGAGKTTLANLLMRFYEISGGETFVDGVNTKRMTREELRKHFSMVLQDTWLFEGTIHDNLSYGRDGLSEKQIEEAASAASADAFIRMLPDGYHFTLSHGGDNISQGERQRLTIARAMACDPEIMILDEATSNVDTYTEQKIQDAMAKLMKGRTSFVIAHRLSTIRDADMILYMENGYIKEAGSHDDLISRHGKYEQLYLSQFAS